ncbi:MAG: hypothetical protein ACRDZN_10935 [Acidimicrobiales bacterium]
MIQHRYRFFALPGAIATLIAMVIASIGAPAAMADPVTVGGSKPNVLDSSITVSNTTPVVGEQITLDYTITSTAPSGRLDGIIITIKADTATFGTLLTNRVCSSSSTATLVGGDCATENSSPPSEFAFGALFTPPIFNGQSASWALQFTVAPAAAGQSFTLDLDAFSAPPVTFTVPESEADIAVGLKAKSGFLTSQIPHTLTIGNNGPATASSATIVTQLPSPTKAVTGLPSGCSYNAGADQVTCTVTSLASGAQTTRSFTAKMGLLTIGLPLTSTATRTSSTPTDPNPANDSASDSCVALTPLIVLC